MSYLVKRHLPLVQRLIHEAKLQDKVMPSTVLSLIHVESLGDPSARRTNPNGKLSEYCGLLQIGHALAKDFTYFNEDFLGNAELSIKVLLQWINQYNKISNYEDELIFIGWKAGVGSMKTYVSKRLQGTSKASLYKWLNEDRWSSGVYLDRCKAAQKLYLQYDEVPLC